MRARRFTPFVDGLDRRLLLSSTDPVSPAVDVNSTNDTAGYPGVEVDLVDWQGPGNPPPDNSDPSNPSDPTD